MSQTDSKPLYERTARAGAWTVGSKLLTKGIDFLSLLVLARFLGPAEFGLVAIAMTAVLIVESVMELPLGLVLLNVEELTDRMFDTSFTLSILRSVVIFSILGALSWPLSLVYHEPRLIALLCALAGAPAMRGLVSPRMILFAKRFDFRRDFVLEVAGKLASLIVASAIAILTRSYWAIAAGTVSTTAVMMLASYIFAPYRPRLTLSYWHLFASTVGWNAASQVMTALSWQMDKLLLPRFIDVASFGRFSSANDLVSIPAQAVIQPVTRPLISAFSAVRQSPEKLRSVYLKASSGIFSAVAPILLTMALLAHPIIRIIPGPNWLATAPFLCWLALSTIIGLPVVVVPALALTLNRTHLVTIRTVTEFAIKLPVVLIGILAMGVTGALIGRAVAGIVVLLVSMAIVKRMLNLSFGDQFKTYARPLLALLPMAAFLYAGDILILRGDNVLFLLINLMWIGVGGLVVFSLSSLVIWLLAGKPDGCEALALRFISNIVSRYLPQRATR